MKEQSFESHSRVVPVYHYVLSGLLLLAAGGALVNLVRAMLRGSGRIEASTVLLLVVCVVILYWYARVFALRAQDRAIRAEENLRHFALTGELLDPRLTMGQVIGLRFAPDAELVELARKAVAEGLSQKAIKREIRVWRADHNRV